MCAQIISVERFDFDKILLPMMNVSHRVADYPSICI